MPEPNRENRKLVLRFGAPNRTVKNHGTRFQIRTGTPLFVCMYFLCVSRFAAYQKNTRLEISRDIKLFFFLFLFFLSVFSCYVCFVYLYIWSRHHVLGTGLLKLVFNIFVLLDFFFFCLFWILGLVSTSLDELVSQFFKI